MDNGQKYVAQKMKDICGYWEKPFSGLSERIPDIDNCRNFEPKDNPSGEIGCYKCVNSERPGFRGYGESSGHEKTDSYGE